MHHVGELVDGPDMTALHAPHEGGGRRNGPYGPRMMVGVLPGMRRGEGPSRGIAGRPEEDRVFRVSATGRLPGRRTLCGFRRRHLEGFKELFAEVVRAARGMGLAHFGKSSVEGMKVRSANRSDRHSPIRFPIPPPPRSGA